MSGEKGRPAKNGPIRNRGEDQKVFDTQDTGAPGAASSTNASQSSGGAAW